MKTLSLSWVSAAFLLLVSARVAWADELQGISSQLVEPETPSAACRQGGGTGQEADDSGYASTEDSIANPLGQYYLWHRYGAADLQKETEQDGPT